MLENRVKMSPLLKELLKSPLNSVREMNSRVNIKNLLLRLLKHWKLKVSKSTADFDDTTLSSPNNLYITDLSYVKCAEEHFDKIYVIYFIIPNYNCKWKRN